MKRKLTCSLVSLCLLTNSVAFAQEAKQAALQQTKGANEIIDEARQILWADAYRIDKELIATSDSDSRSSIYSFSPASGRTSSMGGRFMGGIVGGILGGTMAGLAGRLMGAGTLGTMGLVATGAAGGAMLGGRDNSSPTTTSQESSSSESHSKTYQVHKQADSWGVIVMDVEGYEAAKAKIMNTTAQNSCVLQGIAFLDQVKTFKVMNTKKINSMAKLIEQLQEARTREAILIDQGKGSQQNLENIDAFADQRLSAIRIDWQNYLTETGEGCLASADDKNQARDLQKQLSERFNNTVNIMPQNSMNLLGSMSFANAPYKASTAEEVKALSSVKARAFVSQVKTLKQLQDMGYLRFARKSVSMNGDSGGEINLELGPKALKNVHGFSFGLTHKYARAMESAGILSAMGGGSFATFAVAGFVFAVSTNELIHEKIANSQSVTAATLFASAAGVWVVGKASEGYDAKQAQLAVEQLAGDSAFNNGVNKAIAETEELYDLKADSHYVAKRSSLISSYKSSLATSLVEAMIKHKGAHRLQIGHSYAEYLSDQGVIARSEFLANKVILDFLSSKTVYMRDIDSAVMLKKQMFALQSALDILLKDADLNQEEQKEIKALKAQLDREVLGLSLLKNKLVP